MKDQDTQENTTYTEIDIYPEDHDIFDKLDEYIQKNSCYYCYEE
jgi:hypothetical protein